MKKKDLFLLEAKTHKCQHYDNKGLVTVERFTFVVPGGQVETLMHRVWRSFFTRMPSTTIFGSFQYTLRDFVIPPLNISERWLHILFGTGVGGVRVEEGWRTGDSTFTSPLAALKGTLVSGAGSHAGNKVLGGTKKSLTCNFWLRQC